jgi:hypothetical protein
MIRLVSLLSVPLLSIAVAAQEPTVRLFDIGNLLPEAAAGASTSVQPEPGAAGSLRRVPVEESAPVGEIAPADASAADEQPRANLERFLRTFVEPPLTPDEDVRVLGRRQLAVLGRPAQHAWVEALLAQQRNAGEQAILLDVRVLEASREAFAERFLPWFGNVDPQQKLQTILPPGQGVDQWLAEVLGDVRVESVAAPRVLGLPLRRCEISAGETLHYVRDYEVEFVGEQRRHVARAITADIFDGCRISAICAVLADGTIGVDFEYVRNVVDRPMPKFTTSLAGDDTPLTIDLPSATTQHLQQRLALPDGGLAMLCTPFRGDRYAIALVRVALQPR